MGGQVRNSGVGLVEHKAVNLIHCVAALLQDLLHAPGHRLHRKPEDAPAVHGNERRLLQPGARDAEDLIVSRAAQLGADGGPSGPAFHHRRTGSVAEQHAGGPVCKIAEPAQDLGADHQAVGPGGGVEQTFHGVQGEEKAGAGGAEVKAGDVLREAQIPLQQTGCGGDQALGRHSGHNAGADLLRTDSGPLQGPLGGFPAQLGVGLAPAVMSAADAGAAGDPLVAGIYYPGHVVVGHHLGRDAASHSQDLDSIHGSSFRGGSALGRATPIRLNFSYRAAVKAPPRSRLRAARWRNSAWSTSR